MISRYLFYISRFVIVAGIFFSVGLYSGAKETLLFRIAKGIRNDFQTVLSDIPNLFGIIPTNWIVEKRYPGNGVTTNLLNSSNDLVLLQGFFDDGLELRLINRSGDKLARWKPRFLELGCKMFPQINFLHDSPNQADYWLDYWIAAYKMVLDKATHLHIVPLERLAEHPASIMHSLCNRIDLDTESIDLSRHFHPVRKKVQDEMFDANNRDIYFSLVSVHSPLGCD